jgi:hypothetical protein
MVLPLRGPHRIVLIEAKLLDSIDTSPKVVEQLLPHYSEVLRFGAPGIRIVRNFEGK